MNVDFYDFRIVAASLPEQELSSHGIRRMVGAKLRDTEIIFASEFAQRLFLRFKTMITQFFLFKGGRVCINGILTVFASYSFADFQ